MEELEGREKCTEMYVLFQMRMRRHSWQSLEIVLSQPSFHIFFFTLI